MESVYERKKIEQDKQRDTILPCVCFSSVGLNSSRYDEEEEEEEEEDEGKDGSESQRCAEIT